MSGTLKTATGWRASLFGRSPAGSALGAMPRQQAPLVGGFLLLLIIAVASVLLTVASHRFNASVARTLQIRTDAYRLLTLVLDAETGQRGYLLTGDRSYLEPYRAGIAEIPASIADLEALTVANSAQAANVIALKTSVAAKTAELAVSVGLMQANDAAGALARVKLNTGNRMMETIRGDVDRMVAEEERIQAAQTAAAETNGLFLVALTLVGITLVVGLAGLVVVLSRRATRELLRAQMELHDTNDNLERIVAERVGELQIANEEIQRFAHIVSHDLRAPLVNVMGFTSELDAVRADIAIFLAEVAAQVPALVTADRRMAIETDLPEALGFIRTSTAKMDRLINAILKLSREGRRVLTPQPIDLRGLVLAQGGSLSQQLAAADAELIVQENLPDLVSDRLAIEQIFGNIIENASKYLVPGRPGRITVGGRTEAATLRYDIVDNGRGIDAKDYERVFELFRRSGEQDKPGEGIGLAYVRNLARRLGGNVTVQSELGVGSTFTVTLPIAASRRTKAAR